LNKSYAGAWLAVAAAAVGALFWVEAGQAWTRRHLLNPAPIADAERTDSRFLALLFPEITSGARKGAMSVAELNGLLEELDRRGYRSIGLGDARALYERGRLLPPKAVLLAFSKEDPESTRLADGVIKRRRMRGVVFLTRTARAGSADRRRYLSSHAVRQMERGGAWEFAWNALDARGGPLGFAVSELGLNDADSDPRRLGILPIRSDRLQAVTLRIVENAWPRTEPLADDFTTGTLDPDWIAGWGVISTGAGRMALIPLPRQTGAGVYLRGTEKWRDVEMEFDLRKRQKEFWAYARYRENESYVRFGARDGYWSIEQKTGPESLPTLLARAPIEDDGRPARVSFVLKDRSALVHVNGRMQFGRPLLVDASVARGRLLLGVYNIRPGAALAVLGRFRAGPVKERWIALGNAGLDESRLGPLREAAIHARAISPRWLSVKEDGELVFSRKQETLIRALAGFYGCRLVPMAVFPPAGASVVADAGAAARLLRELSSAARDLDAPGLNLRMGAGQLERPEMARFLVRLRAVLRGARRELWVTADGPAGAAAAAPSVDGVLRPSSNSAGFELLVAEKEAASTP
jgi:hypothetical protein